ITVPLDNSTVSLRLGTSYNALSQVSGFDDVTLDGKGWVLNGKFYNPASKSALTDVWQRLQNAGAVSPADAASLPNNFTTWTRMSDIGYSKDGQETGWISTKQEIQLRIQNILQPKADEN